MNRTKLKFIALLVIASCQLQSARTFAFAEDLCFKHGNDYSSIYTDKATNCLPLPKQCKSDQLSFPDLLKCKALSVLEVLSRSQRSVRIDRGRSLLHLDATYYLAQFIGYSPQEAYQIAIYNQVTDNGTYIPHDQDGNPLLSESDIQKCALSMTQNANCLLTTPPMNGITRHNFMTGGVLLHLGARYADKPTPPNNYPFNYLTTPELEKILADLKNWVYGKQSMFCVAGLTEKNHDCVTSTKQSPAYVKGHLTFLEANHVEYLELNAELGNFIIHSDIDTDGNVIPDSIIYSHQINEYVKPHNSNYAKLGIFLHSLQDRYSHHKCNDLSYYNKDNSSSNYSVSYEKTTCDQGSHMLWHGWEVGTNQNNIIDTKNTTLKPALSATYDELLEYAETHTIVIRPHLNKQKIIEELISSLEIENASLRLNSLVSLFEKNGLTPLPGHGTVRSKKI